MTFPSSSSSILAESMHPSQMDQFIDDDQDTNTDGYNSRDEISIVDAFVNSAPPRSAKSKKRKLSGDERLNRCRERNRIHARNTRERKKAHLDQLQMRVHELNDEKLRLKNMLVESNVAEILVTLHSTPLASSRANGGAFIKTEAGKHLPSSHVGDMDLGDHLFGSASSHELCERIKMQVSRELSDDDELDMERDMLRRDRSGCSPSDLDRLRRERNRMHAKKTRLRKKKMLSELEQLVDYLSGEVSQLHQQVLAQRKLEGLPTIDLSILESGSWSGAEGADDDKHGDDEHDDDDDEEDGEDHRHERGAPKERPRRAQSSSSDECDGGGRSTISDDAVSSNSEERGTTTTAETSSSSSFCSSSSMGSNRYIPTPAYIHDGIQSKASQEADVQARVSSSSSGSDEGDDVSGADASSMSSNISMVATEGSRRGNKVPVKRETSRRKRKGSLKQDMWYGESRP